MAWLLGDWSKLNSGDFKGASKDCNKAIEINPEFDYSYEILKMIKVKLSELNSSKNN